MIGIYFFVHDNLRSISLNYHPLSCYINNNTKKKNIKSIRNPQETDDLSGRVYPPADCFQPVYLTTSSSPSPLPRSGELITTLRLSNAGPMDTVTWITLC